MTVRELAAALLALPEELQDLQVFSTADWTVVTEVGTDACDDYTVHGEMVHGEPVVEIA